MQPFWNAFNQPIQNYFRYTKNSSVKYLLIFSASLVVFGFGSCRKDTSWDTDWVVPIINDTLDLQNLTNDSTLDASGSNYNVNLKRTLFDLKLSDFVSIPDTIIAQSFTLSLPSLNVPAGTSFINSTEEHNLALEDLELKKIILKAGFVDLNLENPISEAIQIKIELPGVTLDGVTFSQTFIAGAGSISNPTVLNKTLDISGYTLDLTGVNGGSFNRLRSKVTSSTLATGNAVIVTNQHHINVKSKFRDVVIKYARGYFGSRIVKDTSSFSIDFFNSVAGGGIDISTTSVKLKIENSVKFDASAKVNFMKNSNYANNEVVLTAGGNGVTYVLDQPTGSFNSVQPSLLEIVYNSGNSNIEEYLENLGIKHQMAYELQINPWGNTSNGWNELFENSRIKLSLEANLPLAINAQDLIIKDTFDFKLTQAKDKSRIISGLFILDADNAFPINGNIQINLLNASYQTISTISATNPIASSVYGSLNAMNILHKKSQAQFVIPESVINELDGVKYISVSFKVSTPNSSSQLNEMVQIPSNAFLGLKLKANFKLKAVVK